MSSLPVELLLGQLLVLRCIFPAFTFVLLPFLTFIRRANHDGQLLEEFAVLKLAWWCVVRLLEAEQFDRQPFFIFNNQRADNEMNLACISAVNYPCKPPNFTPVPHWKGLQRAPDLPLISGRIQVARYLLLAPPSHALSNLRHARVSSSTTNFNHLLPPRVVVTADLPNLKHASQISPSLARHLLR
jgi:hypothetical protein